MVGRTLSDSYAYITDTLIQRGHDLSNATDASCMTRCPAHDDGRPSLSLKKIDGSTLVYCMAGCQTSDVMSALGLKMSDLYDDQEGYKYEYPGGRIVHRTPDKKFLQYGDKSDVSLYHSDRLTGSGPFYVVEGEKDVLAVEAAGGQAVSAPMGSATDPSRFDWEPLRGKTVHVVADRDEPGRKRARKVLEFLTPIAMSVGLYEPIEGKDAADHIAAGHSLRELKCTSQPEILSFSEAMDEWRKWQASEHIRPIGTPWSTLNNKIAGGLHPGRLYVIGARTGSGKSVAGVNLVSYAAESGHPSLVVSVEMPHVEISSRILAAQAHVSYEHITKREWHHGDDNVAIDRYIATHREMPLYICDKATITIEEVMQKCQQLKQAKGLDLLFVDYAQLIQATDRSTSRQEQVSHIVRSCKLLAMDMNIPVILAAQLNRNAEEQGHGGGARAPKMTDLRESGELEQSADVILLLHRDEATSNIYVSIPKNRTGRISNVVLQERFNQARLDA